MIDLQQHQICLSLRFLLLFVSDTDAHRSVTSCQKRLQSLTELPQTISLPLSARDAQIKELCAGR